MASADGYLTLIQALLWDVETLAALTIGTPRARTEPHEVTIPAPPPAAEPKEPHTPTVEAVCSTLRWLRNFRHDLHQQWLVSGKPAKLKSQMDVLDRKANETAELLWHLWQDEDKPRWKQKAS